MTLRWLVSSSLRIMVSIFRRAAVSSSSSSSSSKGEDSQLSPVLSSSTREETPLPMRKIVILGLLLMANNCSIWMIFSFLPFMIHDFFPDYALTELGNRAGYLGSAFSVGSLLGNFAWGVASDHWGRRPALLGGLIGTVFSSALFGFSDTFALAIASRFLWGLLNGNIGVSKTYMAEILDDTNNARGMTLYGIIGGAGRVIGPALGGYLSNISSTYPVFKGTVFDAYPYLMPCLVVSAQCLLMAAVAYFELPETASFINSTSSTAAALDGTTIYSSLPASEPFSETAPMTNMTNTNPTTDSSVEMVETGSPGRGDGLVEISSDSPDERYVISNGARVIDYACIYLSIYPSAYL